MSALLLAGVVDRDHVGMAVELRIVGGIHDAHPATAHDVEDHEAPERGARGEGRRLRLSLACPQIDGRLSR
jgi:hypothetical protein